MALSIADVAADRFAAPFGRLRLRNDLCEPVAARRIFELALVWPRESLPPPGLTLRLLRMLTSARTHEPEASLRPGGRSAQASLHVKGSDVVTCRAAEKEYYDRRAVVFVEIIIGRGSWSRREGVLPLDAVFTEREREKEGGERNEPINITERLSGLFSHGPAAGQD